MEDRIALLVVVAAGLLNGCGSGGGDSSATPTVTPSPSLPTVTVAGFTAQEGDAGITQFQFAVSLDSAGSAAISVNFATSDGSATAADGDFLPTGGVLMIDPGMTGSSILVDVFGDMQTEQDESFSVVLSNPTTNVTLGQPTATGTILSEEKPAVTPPTIAAVPRGVISHGSKRSPLDQRIIDNDNVTGFLVLDGWEDIEVTEGNFDWSHIDSEVTRAKAAGKVVRLAIHAGGDSAPAWIFDNYPDVKSVIWINKQSGATELLPAYWDPTYIEIKRRFYEALGDRYADEPTVFAMSASMVDPNTGDWAFRSDSPEQTQSYLDAGFTEEVFIDAYKTVLDYGMAAFQNKRVITAVGPMPRQLVADRFFAIHEVLDYAFATYGDRLIIAKGALHAETPVPSELTPDNQWNTIHSYSPNVAAQFVWSVSNDPEYKMNGGSPYTATDAPAIFIAAAENGKAYSLRWVEAWSVDLLNSDLQDQVAAAAALFQTD